MMTVMIVMVKIALLLRAGKCMCIDTSCCLLHEAEPEALPFRTHIYMCWKPCMLLIGPQADLCNHHGRNLEYLEGQLEGHRLLQRNKMEIADRQVVLSYPPIVLRYFGHKETPDVNHSAYVSVFVRVRPCCMQTAQIWSASKCVYGTRPVSAHPLGSI